MDNNKTNRLTNDSERSFMEIDIPKKPPPQIIDLADDEIVINIRGGLPDTPRSPNNPGAAGSDGQRDATGFRPNTQVFANKKRQETPKRPDNPGAAGSAGQYDATRFRPYFLESDEEMEEGEEEMEEGEEEMEEETEDEEDDYDNVIEFGSRDSTETEEDSNDATYIAFRDVVRIKEMDKKLKQNDGDRDRKDKNKWKKQNLMNKKIEKRKLKNDKNEWYERCDWDDWNDKRLFSRTKRNESTQKNESKPEHQELKSSPAICSMSSILQALKEAAQPPQNMSRNQTQQGPSNSSQLTSFPQDSQSNTQASPTDAPESDFPQPNLGTGEEKEENLKGDPPVHWTPEMIKFYDDDWGNEKEFDLKKLQAKMDKNPSLWKISGKDIAFWKRRHKRFSVRCFNCLTYGHGSYECKEEKRPPKCHMCGQQGHLAYRCPKSICLNCGTSTTAFVTKCKNCKYGLNKTCERCSLNGHIFAECTDHWRLYHSTIGTIRVKKPEGEVLKPGRNRWCCNCGRRGHLQVECGFCVKNSDFSDTNPFVTSYVKSFGRGTQHRCQEPVNQGRLKIGMGDNILISSQKHAFQRRTSQMRNHMKALKRDMMKKGTPTMSYRRRHFGEGVDPSNLPMLRALPQH